MYPMQPTFPRTLRQQRKHGSVWSGNADGKMAMLTSIPKRLMTKSDRKTIVNEDHMKRLDRAVEDRSSQRERALAEEREMRHKQSATTRLAAHLENWKSSLKGRVQVKITACPTRQHLRVSLKRPWSVMGFREINFKVHPSNATYPAQFEASPLLEMLADDEYLPKYEAYVIERIGPSAMTMPDYFSAEGVARHLVDQAAELF